MKVLGYTDEITTCDCCGKRNLKGSFTIEADDGHTVYYGSVCVNRVYGKKRGAAIQFEAKRIETVKSGDWATALERLSLGHFGGNIMGLMENGKPIWNNSNELIRQVVAIARYNGKGFDVIRERSA